MNQLNNPDGGLFLQKIMQGVGYGAFGVVA